MDLTLSSTQQAFQEKAQRIAEEDLRPQALVRDREGKFPFDALQALATEGLMGVNVSSEYGGSQAGVLSYSLAVIEIAKGDPAIAVTMAVNNMVSEVIAEFGTPAQREEIIPQMTSGSFSSGSFCLSEPGSGSDAAGMTTRVTASKKGFLLNGTKAWITSGAFAGIFLVWAHTEEGISLFLVDPKLAGISVGSPEEKMGQHISNTVSLSFDDVLLPEDALLGSPGEGFKIAMMALDGGRIGIASQSLGIGDAAISLCPDFELRFPTLFARQEAARSITLRAAYLKEKGVPFTRAASIAKLQASEVANEIVRALYATPDVCDPFLEKLLRDARVTRIYEGTSEVQRIVIARNFITQGLTGS